MLTDSAARDYFWAVVEHNIVLYQSKELSQLDYLTVLVDALASTCEVFGIKPRKAEQSELEASKE